MKLAVYRLDPGTDQTTFAKQPATAWARFGDEVFLYTDAAEGAKLATARARGARKVREESQALTKDQLHVVVQNGRLFQEEHPQVPVLLDKGRYLLVKLDRRRARRLKESSPTCYGLFPLRENQVVFAVRDRATARVAKANWVQSLVNRLDRASVKATLTHLASFTTRHSTSNDFKAATLWARDQLKTLNYTTRFQNVTVNGKTSRNVIADKRGQATAQRKVVLVTAHLDSINLAGGPAAPAPGADDNGSGSAGVLELARVLATHSAQHDLRFILFGGEEQGLFGSQRYVASLSATERARILSVINMDMVGTLNTATRSVMLEGASLSQRVIDGLAEAAATYTQLVVETSLNPFASDHVPFIRAAIPAVLTIEGADNTNSNIHSNKDTLNHIDYGFLQEILRMNLAFVAKEIG